MRQEDGISVDIERSDGIKYKEYANSDAKRYPKFPGSFGSRLITATPGTHYGAVVAFDDSFDLHGADGLFITVLTGGATPDLTDEENTHDFYLDGTEMEINQTHRFAYYGGWHQLPSLDVTRYPMVMLGRDREFYPQFCEVSKVID